MGSITIKPDEDMKIKINETDDKVFLDLVQTSFSCCSFYKPVNPEENSGLSRKMPENGFPKSCCFKLTKADECVPGHFFKKNCVDGYIDEVYKYKLWSIVMVVFTIILQAMLFFSFYKHAGY